MKAKTKERLTKLKIKAEKAIHKIGSAVAPWVIPITIASTVAAAWDGYSRGYHNERNLRTLEKDVNTINVRSYDAVKQLEKRIDDLENRNKELLDKACDITEGKETA